MNRVVASQTWPPNILYNTPRHIASTTNLYHLVLFQGSGPASRGGRRGEWRVAGTLRGTHQERVHVPPPPRRERGRGKIVKRRKKRKRTRENSEEKKDEEEEEKE
ncbi:hypothetical protein Pmani_034027 [Petrolisthes manimaculis]|uniref:Uncharacterized protein n=1 Tax=Petrolisthes manimaculis TaxID=1843537 RepID=A0AAE1NPY2_9EUCA|nr:hypothetical protein Pmani_034027 [Petrolisthes manimaculis]